MTALFVTDLNKPAPISFLLQAGVFLSLMFFQLVAPYSGIAFNKLEPLLYSFSQRTNHELLGRLALIPLKEFPSSLFREMHAADRRAWFLKGEGKYKEAIQQEERAVELATFVCGTNDVFTILYNTELALLNEDYGRFGVAEEQLKKIMQTSKSALGPKSFHTVRTYCALAYLYERQGRHAEAEKHNRLRLEFEEDQFKPQCLNRLAHVYVRAGKFAAAESIYNKLAADAPRSINQGLFDLYVKQKRFKEASRLLTRDGQRLAIFDSPTTQANFAELQICLGNEALAEEVLLKNIRAKTPWYAPGHPYPRKLLPSVCTLADLYVKQKRYAEAEKLFKAYLSEKENALGKGHIQTSINLDDLGRLYETQGKYNLAISYYVKALSVRENSLHAEHPEIAESFNNLRRVADKSDCDLFGGPGPQSYSQVLNWSERRSDSER
jgi:tetratricopeptide (TPR) repeat protein